MTWEPLGDRYSANDTFLKTFKGTPQELVVELRLVEIQAGAAPVYKQLTASDLGLPAAGGGRSAKTTFYEYYEVPLVPNVEGSAIPGYRIAHSPGSNDYYFTPSHGDPIPGVPEGWIRITETPQQG